MALQLIVGPWSLIQFLNLYTVGRSPWTGDQPVGRPLPTHRTTQTQNIHTHTDIHALSGIRTHDHKFRASEDSSCLTASGHCERLCTGLLCKISDEIYTLVVWFHYQYGLFV
jgi:hypothetical protein